MGINFIKAGQIIEEKNITEDNDKFISLVHDHVIGKFLIIKIQNECL
jgi:hypothetical protein